MSILLPQLSQQDTFADGLIIYQRRCNHLRIFVVIFLDEKFADKLLINIVILLVLQEKHYFICKQTILFNSSFLLLNIL